MLNKIEIQNHRLGYTNKKNEATTMQLVLHDHIFYIE